MPATEAPIESTSLGDVLTLPEAATYLRLQEDELRTFGFDERECVAPVFDKKQFYALIFKVFEGLFEEHSDMGFIVGD